MSKKTLVIGASENPARYSNMAIRLLREYGHEVVALAKRPGTVKDVPIATVFPSNEKINTVTMYIGAQRQAEYYEDILALQPVRVIFNPGTENPEFYSMLKEKRIKVLLACTLLLLRTNQY